MSRACPSGGREPELAEQAFSEIETLARPVLDRVSAGQALTPRERIALAAFLQMQHQPPGMRENMRFVREQAARLWAQVKLSDREHVREFLQGDGRAVTDEEADAWRADISKMTGSGQITHRPGWNEEVLRAVRHGRGPPGAVVRPADMERDPRSRPGRVHHQRSSCPHP